MRFDYYPETDTLHIEFKPGAISKTSELSEVVQTKIDADGRTNGFVLERASIQLKRRLKSTHPEMVWALYVSAPYDDDDDDDDE